MLISGSGMYPGGAPVSKLPSTRFATPKAGFLKVHLGRGGSPRLTAHEADARGRAIESFATELR